MTLYDQVKELLYKHCRTTRHHLPTAITAGPYVIQSVQLSEPTRKVFVFAPNGDERPLNKLGAAQDAVLVALLNHLQKQRPVNF